MDAKTRKVNPEPMIVLEGYDFRGVVVYDDQARRLVGMHYETDAYGTVWLEPTDAGHASAVDALLAGNRQPHRLPALHERADGAGDGRVGSPAAAAITSTTAIRRR